MADPKWTLGPWEVEQRAADERWIMAGDTLVAVAYMDYPEDQAGDANARLIAAAPDLYEACESALELLENVKSWINLLDDERAVIAKLESALRKARGEDG